MFRKIIKILSFIIFTTGISYLIYMYASIDFHLLGKKEYIINYGEIFKEEGFKALFNNKNIQNKVSVTNNIDYNNLGNYEITYELRINMFYKKLVRKVKIVDKEAPLITLKGDNPTYLYHTDYHENGYLVSDNYSDKINIKITGSDLINKDINNEYLITYEAIDENNNKSIITRKVIVEDRIINKDGLTYVEGVLIVNKKYSLPKDYGSGVDEEAYNQLKLLQESAKKAGYNIPLRSGYRSYERQETIYNNYVKVYGQKRTDTFSARPGHSEHQTGLAFDVGKIDDNYGNTKEGKWLSDNAHLYGFIIRYPKGKQDITGYKYEPWHIRYLGVNLATKVYNSGLCLEEYLNI